MTELEFIKKFVSDTHIEGNRHSSFSIALRNARLIAGRDPVSGINEYYDILENTYGNLPPSSFIGLVNYLIILDMVGSIFCTHEIKASGSAINKALVYYTDLNEKDRYTIDALRNALVHSYSLINIPPNKNHFENSRHKFTLDPFSNIPLITYPKTPWDGSFNDKSEDSSTTIQVTKLIDLIEAVVTSVKERITFFESEDLCIDIDELKAKYTIIT